MSTFLKRQALNLSGTETEKKIGGLLYNDQTDGLASKELNSIAALTFNPKPAEEIFKVITACLDPQQNTWQTLLKAVIVTDHLVKYGAERCVDHCWNMMRRIEVLVDYNSAAVKTGHPVGGRDNGAPVRARAGPLARLLDNPSEIRKVRTTNQEAQGSICPDLGAADFSAKAGGVVAFGDGTAEARADAGSGPAAPRADKVAYGSEAGQTLAAKYDLSHVPNHYEGRPDRFFDDRQDARAQRSEVEDSSWTRQALAPDLLDLDPGVGDDAGGGFGLLPDETPNLAQSMNEQRLKAQLEEQQRMLHQLQLQLGQPGGMPGAGQPMPGMPGMAQPVPGMGQTGNMPPPPPEADAAPAGANLPTPMNPGGGADLSALDFLSTPQPAPSGGSMAGLAMSMGAQMGGNGMPGGMGGQMGGNGMPGGTVGQMGSNGMPSGTVGYMGSGGAGGVGDQAAQLRQLEMLRSQLAQQQMQMQMQRMGGQSTGSLPQGGQPMGGGQFNGL